MPLLFNLELQARQGMPCDYTEQWVSRRACWLARIIRAGTMQHGVRPGSKLVTVYGVTPLMMWVRHLVGGRLILQPGTYTPGHTLILWFGIKGYYHTG